MSLSQAMNIGRSALSASQVGIGVAGNNMANAATPGYTRQTTLLAPLGETSGWGVSLGRGVGVREIRREIDSAVQARLWTGISDESAGARLRDLSAAIETTLAELTDQDISSELSAFFNAWSELANNPASGAIVTQQGQRLADHIRSVRDDITLIRTQTDRQIGQMVQQADVLVDRIGELTLEIQQAETTSTSAGNLRDSRDQAISELSALIEVTPVEHPDGSFELLVGSTPLLLGGISRGLTLRAITDGDDHTVALAIEANGQTLNGAAGGIGALIDGRASRINAAADALDLVTGALIFEVNRLHSTGASSSNPTESEGTLAFGIDDRSRSLGDPENETASALPFAATSGGFVVRVAHRSTGAVTSTYVAIDLDGVDAAGASGHDDDTSADDIVAAIDAIDGLRAEYTADGRVSIEAESGYEFSFTDDTSGSLAVLGVNAFFTGAGASDLSVRTALAEDSSLLLAGRWTDGVFSANGTALGVSGLREHASALLNGRSIAEAWSDEVQGAATRAAGDASRAAAATLVRESLDAQRASISGVNVDEEALNLMAFQRQYQGAARLISVADELTQTLINLV